jgi:hypothetical protein
MAKNKQYPNTKYRLVTGNGPSVFYKWEDVQKEIEKLRTNPVFKDKERFQPKYIIKITEELINIDN